MRLGSLPAVRLYVSSHKAADVDPALIWSRRLAEDARHGTALFGHAPHPLSHLLAWAIPNSQKVYFSIDDENVSNFASTALDFMDQSTIPSPSEHLEPRVQRHRVESGHHPHRVYENVTSGGNSRNVYGDIYNTYYTPSQDSTSAPAHSSEDSGKAARDAVKFLMDALAFDQMDARLATISASHAESCQWLFNRAEYTSWRDSEALHMHHGFFWIKGKPGAGKSTLMKVARQYGEEKHEDLAISFFFNARSGENLEKSGEGMYRSLLHQLLKKLPGLAPGLGRFTDKSMKRSWALAELENMFAKAVQTLGSNALTCYIDALDECNDEEARQIIEHFETLGQFALKADTKFRVLLSSRHYPRISLVGCLELNLENQEEHESDIAEYIRCKLKIGKERLALELQDDIRLRACGVFLWVVLVVRILNKCDARGRTHLLKKHLATIPDGLSQLFRELLQRGTHDSDETLLTLQWILFAQRPLEREELYYVVLTSSSDDSVSERDHYEVTSDVMERFLLDSSKGLAEMTKGSHPTVQFIHESVRDYLLDEGLTTMHPQLRDDPITMSHERLRDCCMNYLERSETALLPTPYTGVKELMGQTNIGARKLRDRVTATHPFLRYAVYGVLYHANIAHSPDRPQQAFVAGFRHRFWRRYYNLCCMIQSHRMCLRTRPLYTFVVMKAQNLAAISIQMTSCNVETPLEGEHYRSLLDAAMDQSDGPMMKLLLQHGADPTMTHNQVLRLLVSGHSEKESGDDPDSRVPWRWGQDENPSCL